MENHQSLKEVKWMGGIGGILGLLSGVRHVGFIFFLAGLILSFLAIKKISNVSEKKEIFRNYLISFLLGMVVWIILLVILFGAVGFLMVESFKGRSTILEIGEKLFKGFKVAGLVAWALLILSAYFYRNSYRDISEVTKVTLFKTAGTVYLIGAILTIIVIGFLVILVSYILSIVAFFLLPSQLPTLKNSETDR